MSLLCFLCLEASKNENFISIDQNNEISAKIRQCLQLKLHFVDNNTSTKICKTCSDELNASYQFYKRIQQIQFAAGKKIQSVFKVKLIPCAGLINDNDQELENGELINNNNRETNKEPLNVETSTRLRPPKQEILKTEIEEDDDNDSMNETNDAENSFEIEEENEDDETDQTTINREERKHATNITNWKTYPFYCAQCIYSTFNFSSLVTHAMTKHNVANLQKMEYQCVDCKKVCKSYDLFLNHVRENHHSNLKLCCDICSEFSKDPKELRAHHSEHKEMLDYPQPFVHYCYVCHKVYASRQKMNSHILSHDDALECQICEKSFKCLKYLKRHISEWHAESKFKCDYCEKTFTRHFNKISHERVHTGEKPYKCPKCNQSFSFQSTMKSHLRIHTGELPYKCKICKDAFRHYDSLKEHTRIHTKETPYKCILCNQDFRFRKSLNNHMRKHTVRPDVKTEELPLKKRPTKDLESNDKKKPKESSKNKCSKCLKNFKSARILKSHQCDEPME